MSKNEKVNNLKGLYIHIPFCVKKCAYCDFYSLKFSDDLADAYLEALIKELEKYKEYTADTLYIGGGTPSLLGEERLKKLLFAVNNYFGDFSESTIEVNPAEKLLPFFKAAKEYGINRISMGMQSSNSGELQALSRRHSVNDVTVAANDARAAGIDNISLDVMLSIPLQTGESLLETLSFAYSLKPKHISAYMLKIEENTPFFAKKDDLNLPTDDGAANLYLTAVNDLEKNGFMQYEISNFALEGYESLHNLKYWNCEEYIGIGAAAHGFLNGKRYCYERDIAEFVKSPTPKFLNFGGDRDEYIMLKLRLNRGLDLKEYSALFGELPKKFISYARLLQNAGFLSITGEKLALNKNGFLVSNEIISELLARI